MSRAQYEQLVQLQEAGSEFTGLAGFDEVVTVVAAFEEESSRLMELWRLSRWAAF